jgi:hypothetical protein
VLCLYAGVWALGRPIDKKRGSPIYVNVINIHSPDRTPGDSNSGES